MAEALWRLRGGGVRLLTAVGDDADGQYIAEVAPGLLLDGCVVKGTRTATYAAVLDSRGECLMGLGDMGMHDHITPGMVEKHINVLKQAPLVVIDGNIPQSTMDHVLQLCHGMQKPVFFEPTDRRKAVKVLKKKTPITYSSPNIAELRAMAEFLCPKIKLDVNTEITEILEMSKILSDYIELIIVTMGSRGVVTVQKSYNQLVGRLYPVKVIKEILNASGAGDCFASGFIYGVLSGQSQNSSLSIGFQAAKCALLSRNTVPSNIKVNESNKTQYIKLDILK